MYRVVKRANQHGLQAVCATSDHQAHSTWRPCSGFSVKSAPTEIDLADAHVFSASHDMLALLKEIREAWLSISADDQVPEELNHDDLWSSVDAAIAKAEAQS